MTRYWLTVATDANDEAHAMERARVAALQVDGSIVDVQPEPPQGATIVGETHEDELGEPDTFSVPPETYRDLDR